MTASIWHLNPAQSSTDSVSAFSWRRQGLFALPAVAGFFLFCLIALDYYQNCAASDCAAVHSALDFFHTFDFAVIFPIVNLLPIPLTLRLFVPCFVLYATMVLSVFALRLPGKGFLLSLVDSIEFATSLVVLFEVGLYFVNPDWWYVHFSNFGTYPILLITNETLATISAAILLTIICGRLVLRFSKAKKIPAREYRIIT